MKKIFVFILMLITLLCSLSLTAWCVDNSESEILQNTADDLFSILDDDTLSALDSMGIDSLNAQQIYNASFSSLIAYFSSNIKEKAQSAFKSFFLMMCVLLITAVIQSVTGVSGNEDYINLITASAITLLTVGSLSGAINSVLSVMDLSAKFMTAYIPIFASLIALSGNAATALTYNTVVLAVSEGISAFSNNFAVSIIGGFFCLSIAFSVNSGVNTNRFVSGFNKCISIAIGFLSTMFASILSIRGIMAAAVDSVSIKGIKFLISSFIPIVGSAITDAYSSLLGSINLIKGSVAVIGILAVVIINIPAIVESLVYYISMSVLSVASECLGMDKSATLFKCFCSGIKFLLLLVILNTFVLVISTGLMLSLKGGS
ncbi:MAG: stage III sporulation protein AE [Faecalibacterium sp.]|nr:stage III sporulation protein AE [Ruminococcus sp.]MCM1392731.1 stage III sporulation protein AE [Ruminococcus sp.]MCM1485201.1 stage III sporulation protein AE [Faecalibacterium sp.]